MNGNTGRTELIAGEEDRINRKERRTELVARTEGGIARKGGKY